jgi:hypothetical protein
MFQSTHLWNIGRHSIKNMALHPRRFWAPNIDFLLQDRDSFQVTNKHSPSKVFYAMKAMTSKNWHFYTSWNLPELFCNYSANWQYLRSTVKRKLMLWKYVKVSSWYKVTSSFSCIPASHFFMHQWNLHVMLVINTKSIVQALLLLSMPWPVWIPNMMVQGDQDTKHHCPDKNQVRNPTPIHFSRLHTFLEFYVRSLSHICWP